MNATRHKKKTKVVQGDGKHDSVNWPLWISVGLIVLTLAVYAPVARYGFADYDDHQYVTDNPHVAGGLTLSNAWWAFTSGYAANWHPLTWLSHMADVELYGMRAGPHHLTNVLLHTISVLLLFRFLYRSTAKAGRSAFVAGLFAVHPLHVESVVWIAERKEVLGGLCWMVTLSAYAAYVRQPRLGRYAILLLVFALGLMAKPVLVTLPFALLLLDVWPLRRISLSSLLKPAPRSLREVVIEKLPLFALSAGVSVITFAVQRAGGAVIRLEQVPLGLRAANAVLSYCLYARDAVWPARLAAFYPRDVSPSLVVVGLAAAMLIGVSIAVVRIGKNRPYLPVGWFWHLGTLVPMIGLVQVGNQSRADRYMYIPLIGVAIIMAWGIPDLSERWPSVKKRLPTLACFVIVAMAVVANVQAGYWKDDAALWTHALDVTSGNYVAHNALGLIRSEHGKPDEAIAHLTEALRIRPEWLEAKNNLANVLARQQRVPEAIALYTEVIQIERNNPELHYNLASALRSLGKVDEAIAHYSEALRIRPRYANAHFRLGATLLTKDRLDEAKSHFNQALSIDSRLYGAHYGLALAFEKEGKIDEAIRECKEALRVEPGYPEAQSKLAELTRLQSGR